jgi:hypothetical protein
MIMEGMSYEDGYKMGVSHAEYEFNTWKDEGPPIPWSRIKSNVREFVEGCLKQAILDYYAQVKQDARERGIDPDGVYFPRVFIKGLEDGYRARLTKLVGSL